MKKPLTSVGAFCYIGSIENNEEYIMKYLLLALSLMTTTAIASEPPTDYQSFKALSKEEQCTHLPSYQTMYDWITLSSDYDQVKSKIVSDYLYNISKGCILKLQLQVDTMKLEKMERGQ